MVTPMTPFVLAHLSDPHLAPLPRPKLHQLAGKRALGYANWTQNRRGTQQGDVLSTLVADMKAQRPDHTAVTGDLVNLALPAEFGPAREWLESLGPPSDVTAVPGNHDAYVFTTRHHHRHEWDDYLRGDDAAEGGTFPFIRKRGPVVLIGVSTAVPTLPLMATGRLGRKQREALARTLGELKDSGLFRVLLIHHPLASPRERWHKRLTDARQLLAILREHGVDMVLHGHDHRHSTMMFEGPHGPIPAIGVPSASAAPHGTRDPAAYNLFYIDKDGDDWRVEMATRGFRPRDTSGFDDSPLQVTDIKRRQPV